MSKLRNLLLSAVCLLSSAAQAIPLSYEFQVAWDQGELAGQVSTGYFTLDQSKITHNSSFGLDLFSDFQLDLNGFHFTEDLVKSVHANFDQFGQLTAVEFGQNCFNHLSPDGNPSIGCRVEWTNPMNFHIAYMQGFQPEGFTAAGGLTGISYGITSIQSIDARDIPSDVPEPSTPALVMLGLGAAAVAIRSRKSNSAKGS